VVRCFFSVPLLIQVVQSYRIRVCLRYLRPTWGPLIIFLLGVPCCRMAAPSEKLMLMGGLECALIDLRYHLPGAPSSTSFVLMVDAPRPPIAPLSGSTVDVFLHGWWSLLDLQHRLPRGSPLIFFVLMVDTSRPPTTPLRMLTVAVFCVDAGRS
jgi:hypothetical protein